jgi:hypothetical protein
MPYQVIKKNNKYAVENTRSGKLHGFTTEKKAEAQKRLLDAIMKKNEKK